MNRTITAVAGLIVVVGAVVGAMRPAQAGDQAKCLAGRAKAEGKYELAILRIWRGANV